MFAECAKRFWQHFVAFLNGHEEEGTNAIRLVKPRLGSTNPGREEADYTSPLGAFIRLFMKPANTQTLLVNRVKAS